jgi:hypothetical protein
VLIYFYRTLSRPMKAEIHACASGACLIAEIEVDGFGLHRDQVEAYERLWPSFFGFIGGVFVRLPTGTLGARCPRIPLEAVHG